MTRHKFLFLFFIILQNSMAHSAEWKCTREQRPVSSESKFLDELAGSKSRVASVSVLNRFGFKISNISVRHKYSDEYKDSCTWKEAIDKDKSTSASMTVNYYTGLLTTGTSWWIISWVDEEGKQYITSAPFSDLRDKLESYAQVLVKSFGPKMLDSELFSSVTTGYIADVVLNSEPTYSKELGVGYSDMVLKKADSDQSVEIRIGPPGADGSGLVEVRRKSKTGKLSEPRQTNYIRLSKGDVDAVDKIRLDATNAAIEKLQKEKKELEAKLGKH